MQNILILNGPNLNLLGRRQPEIYGSKSFDEHFFDMVEKFQDTVELSYYQSNHEGDLIDKLHELGFDIDGIVFNAGGYTHTSIALADAVAAITSPVVEVHISDLSRREPYRLHSYLTNVCEASIMGKGLIGYDEGVEILLKMKER